MLIGCSSSIYLYIWVCIYRYFYSFWNLRFIRLPWSKGNQEEDGSWKTQLIVIAVHVVLICLPLRWLSLSSVEGNNGAAIG